MNIDTKGIEAIVKKVMDTIDVAEESGKPVVDGENGLFQDMNNAIDAAHAAWKIIWCSPWRCVIKSFRPFVTS